MLNSLYIKLVFVLFFLFTLIGSVFLAVALYTAPMYQQEVSQQLNHDLARYIVNEHVLIENGEVKQDNLSELFHNVMIINPSLELYLLDPDGQVVDINQKKMKESISEVKTNGLYRSGELCGRILPVGFERSVVSNQLSAGRQKADR